MLLFVARPVPDRQDHGALGADAPPQRPGALPLRLANFARAECEQLWQQHEAETGQTFEPAIYPELWADTEGQPWLVNALGHELTWNMRALLASEEPLTLADISPDDKQYVENVGLIITRPQVRIANRIYREVIPRELTYRVGRQDLAAQRNP